MSTIPGRVRGNPLDRRGLTWGLVAVAILLALTIFGSDNLIWFDPALVGYLFGLLFAVFGVVYRYQLWLRRPATAMLHRRGWDAFRSNVPKNAIALPALIGTHLIGQGFIRRRSKARWAAHQLLFWGCILAGLVTVPLTMGIIHFESVGQDAHRYRVFAARIGTISFDSTSVIGWLSFHALDIAAFLVLGGVFLFLRRRLHDPGALAVERSSDFLALLGLFAVSVSGLFLTISSMWLEGRYYSALNTLHAMTVILGLMYLPFGKFFHIFQRPGNLGVAYYKRQNEAGEQARCARCGEVFASAAQIADLRTVLGQVGFDYDLGENPLPIAAPHDAVRRGDGSSGQRTVPNFQDNCPRCRRATVTLAQTARVGGFG